MLTFSWYLLKVILCSGILTGYYYLFLRNKIYHRYNRFYLLLTVAISMVLPFLRFSMQESSSVQKGNLVNILSSVSAADDYLDEIVIAPHHSQWNLALFAGIFYGLVSLLILSVIIFILLKIRTLLRKYPKEILGKVILVNTIREKGTPFSFLRYIFWNKEINLQDMTGSRLLRHELVHISEKHSYDNLFIQGMLIFSWINPFFWIIRRELRMIHEFIADQQSVENNDISSFAAMILQAGYPQLQFPLVHHFYQSPIKRRILMLTKIKNPRISYLSRLMVLPLALFILAAFTLKTTYPPAKHGSFAQSKKIVVIDAGHGGKDNGALSAKGMAEKDITLMIAKKIRDLNTNPGIEIVLTRENDLYLDPKERVSIAESAHADLFISIHMDVEKTAATKSGTTVFIPNEDNAWQYQSRLLGTAIVQALNLEYGLPVSPTLSIHEKSIWILKQNKWPSVLIEAGFMTTIKDVDYLMNEINQEKFVRQILNAINLFEINATQVIDKDIRLDSPPPLHQATNEHLAFHPDANLPKPASDSVLIVIDNVVKGFGRSNLKNLDQGSIESVNVLKDKNAQYKYGDKGKYGVIEVTTKPTWGLRTPAKDPDPMFQIGNLNGMKIPVNDFKKQEKIGAGNGYTIISCTVYFSGEGFPNVISINFSGESLAPMKGLMDQCTGGTVITFDNINVRVPDGTIRVIEGKAFILYNTVESATMKKIPLDDKNQLTPPLPPINNIGNESREDNLLFQRVETEAEFPGGITEWRKFLEKNLDPEMPLKDKWAAGKYTVIMRFIVNRDGSITDVQTENYKGSKTAQHCIDIISKGPKWIPARQNGRIVIAYRKQPITFIY